ncbi:MAG: cytochrome c nitrite reductase small subunit [Bacteroidetes bacterium]|jgi:cytochrome c nitrite reductase small subunit|nr:cytochrome c nitrite reductase small subunit [Bacteroidota bacterium]MBT6835498.1 cytochrome c nitrite reductase small subunit [Bacteroidota bacterium]
MKKLIGFITPPAQWKTVAILVLAGGIGMLIYLFYASNAVSYLSDDPKTCVNCHVMNPQYATWNHSSHREVTNCNECHVPHNNIFNKYFFKAKDGMRHATMFTLRREPQVIFIKDEGLKVVQENCKRCHEGLNEKVGLLSLTGENYLHSDGKVCWSCHREVPHGRVNSLSSTPTAQVSKASSIVAEWIN